MGWIKPARNHHGVPRRLDPHRVPAGALHEEAPGKLRRAGLSHTSQP